MRFNFDSIYKTLIFGAVGLSVFVFFNDFSRLKFNTADGSIYLNIAENIADHKGFVVSYNLCQSFNTLYHPIWAYYQPLYPVFASLFIGHGGVEQVISVNILLFVVNILIILYILQRLIPTPLNLLFISFLFISINCFISALYAWTEQLHFFCFIITFILFLKFKDRPVHLFWLGILNGVFMLIRIAHLYNFLAYLPVIFIGKDTLTQKFNRAFSFAGGFILAYGLYQLFCLIAYHAFYPTYARPGASYGMMHFTDGVVYDPHKVGIQIPLGPIFTSQHLLYIGQHLRDFYKQMPGFLWPALFYYFLPADKRLKGGLIELCFFQIIFTILGYSLTFYWLTFSFDSLRYSLIPYILLSVVGWYSMYQGLQLSESIPRKLFGVLVLSLIFLSPLVDRVIMLKGNLTNHPYWEKPYYKLLLKSYDWIDRNLPKEILVASTEDQQAYFMHRPFISIPYGHSYNCTNLVLFNHIYSPDYYLLSNYLPDKCFSSIPHDIIYVNKLYRIYKVKPHQL